jgi:YVTN family beta-propeller protein
VRFILILGVCLITSSFQATSSPTILVSNEASSDITMIDARTNKVVRRIVVGDRPRGIHVSPDRRTLYVAISDDRPNQQSGRDAIVAIDLRTRRITHRMESGTDPEEFGLSPDGRMLYASNEDAGTASIVDLRTRKVLATLVVGIEPEGVAVSPDGRWVYVTAETSNTVSVIDTRKGDVVQSFLVNVRPRGVTFAPDGKRAYVTCEISSTLDVVDVAKHEVIGSVELENGKGKPVGVVVSPDNRTVYVASGGGHALIVVDAASQRVTGRNARLHRQRAKQRCVGDRHALETRDCHGQSRREAMGRRRPGLSPAPAVFRSCDRRLAGRRLVRTSLQCAYTYINRAH